MYHCFIIAAAKQILPVCEIMWAQILLQKQTKNYIIRSYYTPHRCKKTIQEFYKSLITITRNSKQKQIILCGDFNSPDISWEIGNLNTCNPSLT